MASKGYVLNENQVAALTSFTYNLGPGGLQQLTANGTRDLPTIAEKMKLYNKAGGNYVQGLQNRRDDEYALFTDATEDTVTANRGGFITMADGGYIGREVVNFADGGFVGREAVNFADGGGEVIRKGNTQGIGKGIQRISVVGGCHNRIYWD